MAKFDPSAYHVTVCRQDVSGHPYFIGTLAEFPDIAVYEDSFQEAVDALLGTVQDLHDAAMSDGASFPAPITSGQASPQQGVEREAFVRLCAALGTQATAHAHLEGTMLVNTLAATRAALDFVLVNGLPMARDGQYRYHGVPEPVWHATQQEAISAAVAGLPQPPTT